ARTEYLRERNLCVSSLAASGYVFPVVRMEIDFKAPALHDDILSIVTIPERVTGSSMMFRQQAVRLFDGKLLVDSMVTLACISPLRRARRIPLAVRQVLEPEVHRISQTKS
ncbi:MAG: thioesterase family protein, partial [Pseudomonadota bacterium]